MCDTNLCPLLAAYDAAEAVVDKVRDIHQNPALARGTITAYRRTHDVVRERYPCDGPVPDHNNEVACPLGHIANMAHSLATVPAQRTGWAFDPEKLIDGGTDTQSGQYL
jgi:hypothetical protein